MACDRCIIAVQPSVLQFIRPAKSSSLKGRSIGSFFISRSFLSCCSIHTDTFFTGFADILQHLSLAVSAVYSGTLSFWFFPLAGNCHQIEPWVDEIFRQHFGNFFCVHVADDLVPCPVDILFDIYSIPRWVSIRSPTASWEAVVSFNYTFTPCHQVFPFSELLVPSQLGAKSC